MVKTWDLKLRLNSAAVLLETSRRPFTMIVKLWDLKLRLNSAADPMETLRWPSVKMVEPSSMVVLSSLEQASDLAA